MPDLDALTIKPAAIEDVPLILELIRQLAEYENLSHMMVATEERLREHLFGASAHAEALVARVGEQGVGFALFFHNFSTFLAVPGIYLEDIFVRPEFRNRGVGKVLLREVARLALARGCGRLEWSVLNWNAPSIAFYEKLGAKPMSEWTVYRMTADTIAAFVDSATSAAASTASSTIASDSQSL